MNLSPKTIKITIITTIGLLIVSTVLYYLIFNVKIDILVTPESSSIKLNDKVYKNGTHRIIPGRYKIEISKDGFSTITDQIDLHAGDTYVLHKVLYQSDGTMSWYIDHRSDDILMTKITDAQVDLFSNQLSKNYPILNFIPYTNIDSGSTFKIEPIYDDKDPSKLNYLSIFINTCSKKSFEIYKEDALSWIKQKDSKNSYKTEFSTLCETLQ